MGTQVLRPQDCLIHRIRLPHPAVYTRRRNGTSTDHHVSTSKPRPSTRKPAPRPDRNRSPSEPALSKRPSSDDLNSSRSGLAMDKVTILRRGDSFDSKIRSSRSEASLRNDTRSPAGSADVLYAGSAFAVSPEPSSLPLPSFSKKKQVVDDSATRDLRRLLRLD